MGTYRERVDIIADILEVASKNAKKTQIMFQANLSYNILKKYLAEITNASLICFIPEQHCYKLTKSGQDFMEIYKQYCKHHRNFEKRLTHVNKSRKTLEDLCPSSYKVPIKN